MAVESSDRKYEENDKQIRRGLFRYPPRSSNLYPSPWLLINHGRYQEHNTFFDLWENCYYPRMIPELFRSKRVFTSCYGWWVLVNSHRSAYSLLEPISMKEIILPPVECECLHSFTLTAPPSDSNCHFLMVDIISRTVAYGRVGEEDNDFITHEFEIGSDYLVVVAQCKEIIYGIMNSRDGAPLNMSLVKITLKETTFEFTPILNDAGQHLSVPTLSPPENVATHEYLIESCGELLLVEKICSSAFPREVVDVKILRFNAEDSNWVELKNIGDHRAIFLGIGGSTGISCVLQQQHQKGRGNRVYFLQSDSFRIYEFHLLDRSISFSLPYAHNAVTYPEKANLQWVLMPPTKSSDI